MTSEFFVRATPSADGNFAECTYFNDKDATSPHPSSTFNVLKTAGQCTFTEANGSDLTLIGATFSTLGGTPGMNSGNFCPADGNHSVQVSMPTNFICTKGVVLLFSNPNVVDNIYPSSDPQILNDSVLPPMNGVTG
ncbi:hypothetical protein [Roseateles depolymerans]|uniref:Uncharacterized protein n=1 Tax=Roseateles depolymerans TaxID=76731 RepID=A0A0U3MPJ8_9BURK|nr:hypothetical protein [Roseateles depolymerans]ALV04835.1 hypothetical protein RD2015_332 [Roseateles depolymerans]REG15153.1 hypothetical protein DES44_3659 [Roseateles depolymerans]